MIVRMYALRDSKVNEFQQPFGSPNNVTAQRAVMDYVKRDTQSLQALHPEDFSLYYVGDYDSSAGVFTICEHEYVCSVNDFFSNE